MRQGLFIVCLSVLVAGCARLPMDDGEVKNGTLDLWETSLDRPIKLTGTWLAISGANLPHWSTDALDLPDWRPVEVPGTFKSQGFEDEGMVWYRLRVLLPPDSPGLGGYVKYTRNANRLMAIVPGQHPILLGGSGSPFANAELARQSRQPYAFSLPEASEVTLVWQVSNFDYQRGGVPISIVLAPQNELYRWLFHREFDTLLISGIYLMLMLFFLGYWVWNRRDTAALTVSLLAWVTMMRAVVVEGYFELSFGDAMTFHTRIVLEAITFFMLPGLTFLSMWALYPKEYLPIRFGQFSWTPPPFFEDASVIRAPNEKPVLSLPWRRVNSLVLYSMTGVGAVFALITPFVSTAFIAHLLTIFRGLTLAMICLTPAVLFQIVERRRPMAKVTLTAFAIILVATVHDILMSQGVLTNNIYLAPYGLLVFLLMQGYIVARRSAHYAHTIRNQARFLKEEVQRQTRHLMLAMKASEAANAAKTQFLNSVSHEIRTPLTSIIGFTQILEEELGPRAGEQDLEFVHLIRESGDRLLRLVNDLLDLAKIETGRLDLNVKEVALEPVVWDVVRQVFPAAKSKAISLTVEPAPADFVVMADPMRLHQILLNLVMNGLKFTEEGGVSISFEKSMLAGSDEEGRPAVAIRVLDTGCGISEDFLPHVFERFTQELRDGSTTIQGTGLGLALTRELVLRMNGRIDAESEIGHGSTFTVVLPLAAPAAYARPAAQRLESTGDGESIVDAGAAADQPHRS